MQSHASTSIPASSALAMPPPWSLYSWPTVFCQANTKRRLRFVHLGSCVTFAADGQHPTSGQTLWAELGNAPGAGLAWDWVQIGSGVLAMANPMCVVTNLRLVGERGELLSVNEAALYYNRMVCALPWQDEVWRVLKAA